MSGVADYFAEDDVQALFTGNALAAFGLSGNTGTATAFSAARTSGVGGVSGKTLTFTSFNGGTPVNVTFGQTLAPISAATVSASSSPRRTPRRSRS